MKNKFIIRLFTSILLLTALIIGTLYGTIGDIISGEKISPQKAAWQTVSAWRGRTLVIDPGHGGADGGAVSITGTSESVINLQIALRVRALAALFGVDTVMTRESEDIDYPESAGTIRAKKVWDTKRRVEIANSLENAFFISIHQNKYTTSAPSGCQVFYAPTQGSRETAEKLQKQMLSVAAGNRQSAVQIGGDIYIMNNIKCPGVLIECGFVSNPAEALKLEDPGYQLTLASAILGGYLAAGERVS